MSSPAGFPPDHYLASPIQRGKAQGAHVPAWDGQALLVLAFPSLVAAHQNSHLGSVSTESRRDQAEGCCPRVDSTLGKWWRR